MRRSLAIFVSAVAVAALVFAVFMTVKYRGQSARYSETRQSEEAVRNQFNTALLAVAEIQDSLDAIAPREAQLRLISQNAELDPSVTQSQKDQMLGTISDLKHSIDASNQRIRDLEKSLRGSDVKVAGLQRVIANLKQSVAEKEVMVRVLTVRVDSLTTTVAGLQTDLRRGEETIVAQQTVIEDKQREIGAMWYIVGTKKELQDKGIITQAGGLIGIGKTSQVSGTFSEGDFTRLDTDLDTEIEIPGTEPRVLSAQITSSYQLEAGEKGGKLVITNPAEFRKVKYLVILVKKRIGVTG